MMLLTTVVTAPTSDDFTPLSEHNEQTPGSFFAGKPVLHLQAPAARLQITKDDLESQEAIKALVTTTDDVAADDQGLIEVQDIDVWVTSRHLTLWSPTTNKGAQISYQAITVHAQVGDAVLLELNLSNSNNVADEDIEHLQLRIAPDELVSPNAADADLHANEHANGGMNGHANPSFQLYMAIGDCQNLNPDPAQDDEDEEGGMGYGETAPGATGWITSENMHEYTDENGNFVMPEGATVIGDEEDEAVNGNGHEAENGDGNEALGEGAGRIRRADEINGLDGANDEETKWQKTG